MSRVCSLPILLTTSALCIVWLQQIASSGCIWRVIFSYGFWIGNHAPIFRLWSYKRGSPSFAMVFVPPTLLIAVRLPPGIRPIPRKCPSVLSHHFWLQAPSLETILGSPHFPPFSRI